MKKSSERKSGTSGKTKTKTAKSKTAPDGEGLPKQSEKVNLLLLLDLMREYHIENLTLPEGITVHMAPSGFKQRVPLDFDIQTPQGDFPKDPLNNPMTEDEILFWSSGGSEFKDTHGNEVPVPLTGEGQADE